MKRIKSEDDLMIWYESAAYFKLNSFLDKLFKSIEGKKLSEIPENPIGKRVVLLESLLVKVDAAVDEIEPIPIEMGKSQRYGNKSFKILIERIKEIISNSLIGNEQFLKELFIVSFGDSTRIDYGTGHELSFIIFVSCYTFFFFEDDDKFTESDYAWLAGKLIGQQYFELVRKIQQKYSLEPAGSHGVWGLDDHQFLPFLLGSSQLIGRESETCCCLQFQEPLKSSSSSSCLSPENMIKPQFFSNQSIRNEYLYPVALYHIHKLKTRLNPSLQFYHHSPLLYDISGIPTWQRIHEGLRRMYTKEVLSKFPVVQHILFDEKLFKFAHE